MGTTRTKRKNAAKRRARRVFAAIAAELQASEEKQWTPEALELERMRNEEERQRVHETWKRAVDASNEAFQKQKRILDERTRLLAAIREELEQEKKEKEMEKSESVLEKASTESVQCGKSDSPAPSGPADVALDEGALLARDAQALAYEAMRRAAHPKSHDPKPVLPCAFHTRTGCCPFAQDRCGLSHQPSSESRFLLLKHVYQPQSDGETTRSQKLAEFRKGLIHELEKHGSLVRLEVVTNVAPHLNGNVYAEYRSPAQARSAWSALHLRWKTQNLPAHLFSPLLRRCSSSSSSSFLCITLRLTSQRLKPHALMSPTASRRAAHTSMRVNSGTQQPQDRLVRSVTSVSSSASTSTSSGAKEGKLPLPDDFFTAPQLNSKETKYLISLAKRACKEVVYYSRRSGGPMNWIHLSSEDGFEIYQGIDETANESKTITYLRGSTRISATIDEIADFFKLDTPSKLSGFTQTVGKDLLDQKTLYDLAMPTPDNPKHYVGVKWTAVESPSKLARNRDLCYLECHDEFIDTNSQKRGWVRSLHSIRLPFCPPLNRTHGLVRASLYRSGFVFIESDEPGYVDAIHTLHMDIKGNAPNWMKILVMKRRIKNISEVNRYFQMRRLCEGRLLGDLELPSKSGVSKCQLCDHKFKLFSRKTTCRKCGKIVCSACGHNFILDYAGTGAKKVRICAQCVDVVIHGSDGMQDRPTSHVNAKECEPVRPIYDNSPSSAQSRPHSMDEHEYFSRNEDDRGRADILAAKRMNREFEEHFTRSGERPPIVLDHKSKSTAGHQRPPPVPHRTHEDKQAYYPDFLRDGRDGSVRPSMADPSRRSSADNDSFLYDDPLSSSRSNDLVFESLRYGPSDPVSPPREIVDSIRISSDWSRDYMYNMRMYHGQNASIMSDETVGAPIRRSDLSMDPRSSMASSRDYNFDDIHNRNRNSTVPNFPGPSPSEVDDDDYSLSFPSSYALSHTDTDTHSKAPSREFEEFRRSYFSARNSDIVELEQRVLSQSGTDDEGDFRYGYDAAPSTDADYYEEEYEIPVPEVRQSVVKQPTIPAPDQEAIKKTQVEELATVMALSAMRLYEKENGLDMQVSDETRQAALQKMVEIYASEIERNNSDDQRRGVESQRPVRSVSDGRNSESSARILRMSKDRRSLSDNQASPRPQDPVPMEYRDLSDLSASAFKAFQRESLHPSPNGVKTAASSVPSSAAGTLQRHPSFPESRSSSHRNGKLGPTDGDDRSRAGTIRGSLSDMDVHPNQMNHPDVMRDDASDTFSEVDFVELPHLMRADEPRRVPEVNNERRSLDNHQQAWSQPEMSASHQSMKSSTSQSHKQRLSETHPNDYPFPTESERISSDRLGASMSAPMPAYQTSEWTSSVASDYSVGPSTMVDTTVTTTSVRSPPLRAEDLVSASSLSSIHTEALTEDILAPLSPRSNVLSSCGSDEADYMTEDEASADLTSRSKMTMTELKRYRASLAELMAEYNGDLGSEGSHVKVGQATQPEREPEQRRPSAKKQQPKNLEHGLQELYL
ncbi:hypothetical protein Poli38472_007675 [Pythium oligandrum]|uniref:FYVE-type domain-containing protein n=1 Tax=Pythium oligandrum TaxID=41045 RepID=A0A8K1CTH7_PYTOL|nr:hypothetical protein Poli38472_007675 [Pythium oligandrum]|eukprot:TMW68003.1 hypothetical protein Poli38472_007675 [Pythium oligandrum]